MLLTLSSILFENQHQEMVSSIYKPTGKLSIKAKIFWKTIQIMSEDQQKHFQTKNSSSGPRSCKYKLKEDSLLIYIALITMFQNISLNFTGSVPKCSTVFLKTTTRRHCSCGYWARFQHFFYLQCFFKFFKRVLVIFKKKCVISHIFKRTMIEIQS